MSNQFLEIAEAMEKFSEERDWNQYHSPKNLSMALTVEASELQECFQWLTEKQSENLEESTLLKVKDEIADVQLYLVRLASKLHIDIEQACKEKMKKNIEKYPANLVKGSAKKYSDYEIFTGQTQSTQKPDDADFE